MTFLRICVYTCMTITLIGCVTPPKTPDELRSAVKSGMVMDSRSEVFTVNRPFHHVVESMNKKWTTCLAQTITIRYDNGRGLGQYVEDTYRFNPSVSSKGSHVELLLQQQRLGRQAVLTGGKLPEKGFYAVVVDIDAINAKSTRVSMHELPMTGIGFEGVMKSGRAWAEGNNGECPDLSK
jgi:hypothetical protein